MRIESEKALRGGRQSNQDLASRVNKNSIKKTVRRGWLPKSLFSDRFSMRIESEKALRGGRQSEQDFASLFNKNSIGEIGLRR